MSKLNLQTFRSSAATKALNASVSRLSRQGLHREVLLKFSSALNSFPPFTPDAFTFPSLLKATTSLRLLSLGLSLHQRVLLSGLSSDPFISSSLISFYAKFNNPKCARKVFDAMPERDIILFTAIIGCYARAHDMSSAFLLVNSMQYEGVQPSSITILNILSGVLDVKQASVLHAGIIKGGHSDLVLKNCLLNVYARCGSVEGAEELFNSGDCRDIVSWNSLMNAYSMLGDVKKVTEIFLRMRDEGIEPDCPSYVSVFSAIAGDRNVEVGRKVHAQMVTSGFEVNKQVETSLLVMYSRCNKLDEALQIFRRSGDKDAMLWTSMISGLLKNASADQALRFFGQMLASRVTPSSETLSCVLTSCAELGDIKLGTSIHCYMLRHKIAAGIYFQNSLVSMYVKCGRLKQGFGVFSMMSKRNVVSWNTILVGYAQSGYLTEALRLFNEMRIACQKPDYVTASCLLQACGSVGAYQQGKWIHNFVVRGCLLPCVKISTALVDMYSKCGDLVSARRIFDRMLQQDKLSWSTIIAGYGSNGKAEAALEMYSQFLHSGFIPDDGIFIAVLYACSHGGLVDPGMLVFQSMKNVFKIKPNIEHCGCIIDLLCRAGRVQDAFKLYEEMFAEPAIDVLGMILDACRKNGNIELGEIVAHKISKLKPADAVKFVQLAHSLASVGKWNGVGEIWAQMRFIGLRKLPGWSFIETKGTVTPFFMHQNSHPQYAEIVAMLRTLTNNTKELVHSERHEEFALGVL